SAAVSAGNRLYCWKMNPRFWRRNRMRSPADNSSTRVPSTVRSPAVRSSNPAMMEMSVVLPQPLGPTRRLSSPNRVSKSTPRKAPTLASPDPNCLRTPRQDTPKSSVGIGSPSEHGRRLQHQHATNAEDAGEYHDEEDAAAGEGDALPHQNDVAGLQQIQGHFEKKRRRAGCSRPAPRPRRGR